VAKRRDAVEKLDAWDAREARPYLYDALSDADIEVRARAAQAIGRRQLGDAAPRLVALTGDVEPRLRAAAAEALGRLGDGLGPQREPALKALERALGDSEHEVRAAAVAALGRLGDKSQVAAIAARLDDDKEHVAVREQAAQVLARIGDPRAVIPLIGALGNGSREVRRAALEALGQLGDERAAAAMIRLLRADQPDEVRAQAAQSLGRLRSRSAIAPLADLVEHGPDALRARAAMALGQIAATAAARSAKAPSDDAALTALVGALGRDETRAAAREALALAGPPAATALIARLEDARGEELAAVVDLLATLGDARAAAPLESVLESGRVAREKVIDALGAIARAGGPSAMRALTALLSDGDASVRRHAMSGLKGACDARSSAALIDALSDGDREVRLGAIAELGRLKAQRAIAKLTAIVSARDRDDEAAEAALALGQIGADARAAQALADALDRTSPRLRRLAADALERLRARPGVLEAALSTVERLARSAAADRRADAIAALGGLLRKRPEATARELLLGEVERAGDPTLAVSAVEALAAIHDSAAAPRLERVLARAANLPSLRRAIVSALGSLGSSANLIATRLDEDPDPSVRAEAAWALGKLEANEPALQRALDSSTASVRINAAAAFARLGRSTAALERLRRDGDPAVRANAQKALAHARPPARSDFTAWHLVDYDGAPLPETAYRLELADGLTKAGVTDPRGDAREEDVPPGAVRFDVP
jgi:HEAT repeat protein